MTALYSHQHRKMTNVHFEPNNKMEEERMAAIHNEGHQKEIYWA